MDIDLVLPYVDMNKDKWKQLYDETNRKLGRIRSENSRYRQILDLKYLLRCINKHCPFIRTLYLVVQTRDQVPDYIKESNNLKIIEHQQIIPKDLLPTYNSATIELHVHRIPGLAEHFIYINDDMYPINDLNPTDFFTEDGKPKINVSLRTQPITTYRQMLKNSELFVRRVLGIKERTPSDAFYRDGHSWTPMIKSHFNRIYNLNPKIRESCSTFRESKNMVQQVITYYEYFTNNFEPRELKTKYWDFKKSTNLHDFLDGSFDIVCINDCGLEEDVEEKMAQLETWFQELVPNKSEKYEK